jgi:hypothetical protein
MKTIYTLPLIMCCLAICSCNETAPEAELQNRIQTVIELMEQEDYEKFLVNFYPPSEVEALRKRHNIKKLAKYFGEGPQKSYLLNYLKTIQDKSPKFNETKTKAHFTSEHFDNELVWQEVNGKWYLVN